MKINSTCLSKFLKKISLDKMIGEITFNVAGNMMDTMVCDAPKRVIIEGIIPLLEESSEHFRFSLSSTEKFSKIISSLDEIIEIKMLNGVLVISDENKQYSIETIETGLYDSMKKAIDIKTDNGTEFTFTAHNEPNVYTEYIETTGKVMKKALDDCEIIGSEFYFVEQEANQPLYLHSEQRTNALRIKLPFAFKTPKAFWMINFCKEIFKKNPGDLRMWLKSKSDPMVLQSNSDGSNVSFVISSKAD